MEREHEPAAAPAPAVAAPASAGAGPLIGALSPARVLAMQRTAGNRAVAAFLAREDKPAPTPAAGPGDFGVAGGVPSASGTSTAAPNGTDKVTAKAPRVGLDGKAWLKEGKTIGSAYLGLIQNLVASDRAGVYRHGGDPAGEIVAEKHEGVANKWDAVNDPAAEAKGEMVPQTFAPFYWQPGNIDDSHVADNPASVTRLGTPFDQPEFTLPIQEGAGRLTAFKGKDTFKTGVAVKKNETVWMLNGTTWSVDWNIPVDASLNGAGKAIESAAIQDLIKDGPDPTLKDWSLKPGAGSAFEGFSTVALAMKRTPSQLLSWLFAARRHDPVSYKNICAALDALAPSLNVTVACSSTDSNWHSDHLSASIKRGGALIKTHAGIELNNGESTSFTVAWADAFGSATALAPGTEIAIELSVGAELHEASATIGFPFSGSRQLAPGDGKYTVSLGL